MMGHFKNISVFILLLVGLLVACSKSNTNPPVAPPPVIPPGFSLSYGDTIFYTQTLASDYIINPVKSSLTGIYTGFPEGIEIDTATGAINVSKSEMGLRYKISFIPTGSKDTFNTIILLSGINFLDGFYKLSTADSVLNPIYNGNASNSIPGVNNGSVFDEGSNCNGNGCAANTGSGSINLAQTVRNGVFGAKPANNDRHEFQMNYRINDKSGKSLNSLKVKLYYFDTMNDVTQEVYDIITSRQGTILQYHPNEAGAPISGLNEFSQGLLTTINGGASITNKPAKPRPPCIFVVAK